MKKGTDNYVIQNQLYGLAYSTLCRFEANRNSYLFLGRNADSFVDWS
jgi:hypothetical protein